MKALCSLIAVAIMCSAALLGCQDQQATAPEKSAQVVAPLAKGGFNEFGYNYQARIFNGPADGVDKILDGKVWGDPTYANDHLVMKWNDEWDRGNDEAWSNPPYAAWENNEWNGNVRGGSGEVWHYKIKWIGGSGPNGETLPDGGYRIWGIFEVIMSQGTVANQHFWDAHATPAGYGTH